jgi:hypothetical protein
MSYTRDLKRLTTRADLARAFGVDPRRKLLKDLRPVALLLMAGREYELFEANLPASLVVNSAKHPLVQSIPELT